MRTLLALALVLTAMPALAKKVKVEDDRDYAWGEVQTYAWGELERRTARGERL